MLSIKRSSDLLKIAPGVPSTTNGVSAAATADIFTSGCRSQYQRSPLPRSSVVYSRLWLATTTAQEMIMPTDPQLFCTYCDETSSPPCSRLTNSLDVNSSLSHLEFWEITQLHVEPAPRLLSPSLDLAHLPHYYKSPTALFDLPHFTEDSWFILSSVNLVLINLHSPHLAPIATYLSLSLTPLSPSIIPSVFYSSLRLICYTNLFTAGSLRIVFKGTGLESDMVRFICVSVIRLYFYFLLSCGRLSCTLNSRAYRIVSLVSIHLAILSLKTDVNTTPHILSVCMRNQPVRLCIQPLMK